VSGSAILGDWGNSRLRLWRLEQGKVAERRDGPGMVQAADPPAALTRLLDGWGEERIVLSGMAGARGGLHEAPYLACPVEREAWARQSVRFDLEGKEVVIAPGVAGSNDIGGPDVMRGEETQVFGAMVLDPALAEGQHLVVLPGTHSKWVLVEDGRITGFTTHMTGELFELLGASTLSLAPSAGAQDDDAGFSAGLARAEEGAALTAGLFEARAAQLQAGKSPEWARGFVSGLLIGTETRSQAMHGAKTVVTIGEPRLTDRYSQALEQRGVGAAAMNGEECAVAGLRLVHGDD
jgi:2-dehydro-3-deoxygalactonokinase